MYALRTLFDQRLRLALTVGGVALCVILMLFLWSVYEGVRFGSVEYVRASDADLWVLQRHRKNILRSTSILPQEQGEALRRLPGVGSASPVVFTMAAVQSPAGTATAYVTGFDPSTGVGGPPLLLAGRPPARDGEIVLDRAFARKLDLAVGDVVRLGDTELRITGLSTGTNMFVIQYAFTCLAQAQALGGLPGVVSAWLVGLDDGADAQAVAARIRTTFGVEAYDHATFVANNVREMEAGFLPILFAVAVLGAIVLTAILSLILSVSVLEHRKDFAVMKAVGAPPGFVARHVVHQALVIASLGLVTALGLFFPLVRGIEVLAPEVSTRSTVSQVLLVAVSVGAISLLGSILPVWRLRRIYPLEVFR